MASSTPHTIVVEWPTHDGPKFQEALAFAAIGPGELVTKDSNGRLIIAGAWAGGTTPVPRWVAVESPTAATAGSTNAIDTDYASGDTVRYVEPPAGALLYMYLASGENVALNAPLAPDGAGALEASVDGTMVVGAFVGWANEAVNASAGLLRIHVRMA